MTLNYHNTWDAMNELETVTSKICSVRAILECAIVAHETHDYDKVETLMYAVDEYLQYYLQEFDAKFKVAWKETVVACKSEQFGGWGDNTSDIPRVETKLTCDKDDPSSECKGAWNSFWEENYYFEEVKDDCMPPWGHSDIEYGLRYTYDQMNVMLDNTIKQDKVVKWLLPVQRQIIDGVDDYYIQFPDDLLETANLKGGDTVYWVDNNDGTYTIRKETKLLGMDEC